MTVVASYTATDGRVGGQVTRAIARCLVVRFGVGSYPAELASPALWPIAARGSWIAAVGTVAGLVVTVAVLVARSHGGGTSKSGGVIVGLFGPLLLGSGGVAYLARWDRVGVPNWWWWPFFLALWLIPVLVIATVAHSLVRRPVRAAGAVIVLGIALLAVTVASCGGRPVAIQCDAVGWATKLSCNTQPYVLGCDRGCLPGNIACKSCGPAPEGVTRGDLGLVVRSDRQSSIPSR